MSKEFIDIYNDRCKLLLSELGHLTVDEVRVRYKNLWDGCPAELHIHDFSVIKKIETIYPNFHIEGVTKKTFKIHITKMTEDEIKEFNEKLISVFAKEYKIPKKYLDPNQNKDEQG